MITPKEIETKEFTSTKGGGYKGEEVDQFLDEILVDYSSLLEERNALKNKVSLLTDRLNSMTAPVSAPVSSPAPAAPVTPSEEMTAARKKADRLVAEAEDYAKKLIETAQTEANRQNAVNQKLSKEIEQFKTSLIDSYTNHIKMIQELPKMDLADVTIGSETLEILNESFADTSVVSSAEVSDPTVVMNAVPSNFVPEQKTVYSDPEEEDFTVYSGKRGKAVGTLTEDESRILRTLFDEQDKKNKKPEKKKKKLFFKDDDDDDDDYFDDDED